VKDWLKSVIGISRIAKGGNRICFLAMCFWLAVLSSAPAKTTLNVNDPLGFFTTLADKMLRNTFAFGVTNIPVYSNGQFVYSPAVNRILQLAANVYDASTNSFYPDVFRPIFEVDEFTNLFIVGYTNVAGVNPAQPSSDNQFSLPLDVTQLGASLQSGTIQIYTPFAANVYGVPWIIGAKKNLPGFNQFSLVNTVQVTRKLQVGRKVADGPAYTNHLYQLSISNSIGASFWNSYSNDYVSTGNGLTVIFSDFVAMVLTNSDHPGVLSSLGFNDSFILSTNFWPGSHWSGKIGEAPATNSFITAGWNNTFMSGLIYKTEAEAFALITDPDPWESNNISCDPLPQFGLLTTNWMRAIIVDNGHVIDFVQLRGPIDATNITTTIADPPYVGQPYLWATNAYPSGPTPSWGYVSQIDISEGNGTPPAAAIWKPEGYPGNFTSVGAGTAYFAAFFTPLHEFTIPGQTTENFDTNLLVQAGYTATRTTFVPYLYQANDPMVHYLASDLDAGIGAVWDNGAVPNGVWSQVNAVVSALPPTVSRPAPIPPFGDDIIKGRYQPWGRTAPPALQTVQYNFGNPYNSIYKDPLVWSPDYWNFPTNLLSDLTELGQVHRGTPWQSVYFKAGNVIQPDSVNGTNTWAAWSGDWNFLDAAMMAPVNDWQLASVIIAVLNTNDVTQLISVNDPNLSDWSNLLNGLIVYSNSVPLPPFQLPIGGLIPTPTFDTYVMAGDSTQAGTIAASIAANRSARQNQSFNSIGDILSDPDLTQNSPWLNYTNLSQVQYGITDSAYEAIPAQLLLLLRPDSVGALSLTNGLINLQFSGSDAYCYEVQESTNLANWISITTNNPVQGGFNLAIPVPSAPEMYYRSVLLP
jgi:hypothetical protein